MDTYTLIATFGVGLIIYFVCRRLWSSKKLNLPPGPPYALPILGHLHQIDHSVPTHRTFGKWADKYGPIYGMRFGLNYAVVLSDPKLMRDVLNDPIFNGRPDNRIFKLIPGGNYGLLFADGPTWLQQRRFTLRHLREFGFGKNVMESLILEEAKDLLDAFRPDVGRSITGLGRRFSLAVLSSLWFIVAGERVKHDDTILQSLLEELFHQLDVVFAQGTLPLIPQLATIAPERSGFNAFKRAIDRAMEHMEPYITEHERTRIPGSPRDFIDSYLDEMERTLNEPSSTSFHGAEGYKNLLAVITDLFGAGAETTSTTLDWAVLYLASHPHVQKELQEEIDSVLSGRLPSLGDKPRMPFTEAVMLEVFRYSSIAGLGLFHTPLQDTRIGGYDIPKGTWIVPNFRYVHYNPKLWDRPDEFNPHRFLSKDIDSDGVRKVVKNDVLTPFSVGKRSCPGETLARDEFFLFLVCLFQRYSIQLDPNRPSGGSAPLRSFILKPHPYYVIMHERV